ncbi:glycosyl hydrolase family 28 protein [Mucilaginibacter terrae]|uniref:glycosyl hydrolase family 28 protein n=1 Tax=Mucilaginibacter terrae TaxID=1955052 RepID=UPI00363E0642
MRYTRQKSNYRNVLNGIGDGPVLAFDHPQQMVVFAGCKNVRVQNITLLNAPARALCLVACAGVVINGARIWSYLHLPDAAGINISDSKNIVVNACDIHTGNNAIAVAGFDDQLQIDGFSMGPHLSYGISISNCSLQSGSTGILVSSLEKRSVKNISVNYVNITNPARGVALILRDEGSLENMAFNNLYIQTGLRTRSWVGNGEPVHLSAVRGKPVIKLGIIKNISFSSLNCTGENQILLYGSKESPIQNVRFDDVIFKLQNSSLNEVAGGNIDFRVNTDQSKALFASNIPAVMARNTSGLIIIILL